MSEDEGMTLTEAIERGEAEMPIRPPSEWMRNTRARALLIEAGRRELRNRSDPDVVRVGLLPGETE